ncbi:uncharacterized protein A4U43_C01F21030 [Asparagus officinalis]|uniref:Uncharacterized protein n=1 Tax=Asparagus officinalis TaxID=4686 RepID=A0A5P1FRT2_ASPOF|nr:uncharacterized protein A4U43_C01F21030 [Asparagus officinalis]
MKGPIARKNQLACHVGLSKTLSTNDRSVQIELTLLSYLFTLQHLPFAPRFHKRGANTSFPSCRPRPYDYDTPRQHGPSHSRSALMRPAVDQVKAQGLRIRFLELKFPRAEAGLPEGRENIDLITWKDQYQPSLRAVRP